jgi:hypothetical protein
VLKAEAGGLVQPMPAGGVEVLIGVIQERWQASPTVGV